MNIQDLSHMIVTIWSYTLTKIILVILLALLLNRFIKSIINRLFRPKSEIHLRNKQLVQKSRETANRMVLTIIKIIIWVSAILVIFSLMNIETSSILAGAGFFGLIFGLGSKTLIESIVNGFFLVSDGNLSIHDFVKINGIKGIVQEVGLRNVVLLSNTGETNIIPVSSIKEITNYSMNNQDVLINVSIPLSEDFMKVMNSIKSALKEMSTYLDISSDLSVTGFNLDSDHYEVRIACQAVQGMNVELQALIKVELDKCLEKGSVIWEEPKPEE